MLRTLLDRLPREPAVAEAAAEVEVDEQGWPTIFAKCLEAVDDEEMEEEPVSTGFDEDGWPVLKDDVVVVETNTEKEPKKDEDTVLEPDLPQQRHAWNK
eukprot:789407-Lingulodinium_polyedra.AAC.1